MLKLYFKCSGRVGGGKGLGCSQRVSRQSSSGWLVYFILLCGGFEKEKGREGSLYGNVYVSPHQMLIRCYRGTGRYIFPRSHVDSPEAVPPPPPKPPSGDENEVCRADFTIVQLYARNSKAGPPPPAKCS